MRALLLPGLLFLAACSADVGSQGTDRAKDDGDDSPPELLSVPVTTCLTPTARPLEQPQATSGDDPIDEALANIRLDRSTFGLTPQQLALSRLDATDPRVFEATKAALHTPARLPSYGRHVGAVLDLALASRLPVTRAILEASAIRESPVSACVTSGPPPSGAAPLSRAIADLRGDEREREDELVGVPLDVQAALVPVVRAMAAAAREILRARGEKDVLGPAASVPSWLLGVRRFELTQDVVTSFERIDSSRIIAAGASVAYAVEEARLGRFRGIDLPSLVLATPIGPIVLHGPGDDVFEMEGEAPALLIDTGGDDTYRGAVAAATFERPISVLVDLGGRDAYGYAETNDGERERLPSDAAGRHETGRTLSTVGRQGSGNLGVGLLFDLGGGDDEYRSLVASQGAGAHGLGVLYDDGGADRYEAEGFSQGAAAWGIGLLLDGAGDDRYTLHNSGQGFGFTRGFGGLVDVEGADVYRADPGATLLYPSDQLPGVANHSFAQGCGAGHRPDWPDPGFGFPGGIGVLRDAAGDDHYVAGVFAQACGFVQGMGALLDGAGNDLYEGLYYVQGTAAHVGASLFFDQAGDDRYNPSGAVAGPALGMAHDLAVAVHFDGGGDDAYTATWGSFGAGLANGVAMFVNDGGNDRLETNDDQSFGRAATTVVPGRRVHVPTVGVFVKAGGPAAYIIKGRKEERSGRAWGSSPSGTELESGVDRPYHRAAM